MKKLLKTKLKSVVLTVFTLFTFLLLRLHSESGAARGQDNEGNCAGLERPQVSLWPRNRVQKWGRSSPTRCFARVQVDRRGIRKLFSFGALLDRHGEREGERQGDLCLSCTRYPPTLAKAIETL